MDGDQNVIKKDENAVAAIKAPARGFEEPLDKDDIIIPRAKLLQALSPEVQDPASTLKAGLIINSLDKVILPAGFVPIFKFTNWIRFNPRKKDDQNFDPAYDPGAMIYKTSNRDDPRLQEDGDFGPNGERPKATKFMNFFCLFPGQSGPVVLSFSSTSFKAGKKLYSLAMRYGGDMFGHKYTLIAKSETNDIGTYFVLDVEPAGITDEAVYKITEAWYDQYVSKLEKIVVHEEDKGSEATGGEGTS